MNLDMKTFEDSKLDTLHMYNEFEDETSLIGISYI